MKAILSTVLTLLLPSLAPSQEKPKPFDPFQPPPGAERLAKEVGFVLDPIGKVMVFPSPSAGGAPAIPADPVIRTIAEGMRNVGLLGYLALFAAGDTDLASSAGADTFLRRIGRDDPATISSLLEAQLNENTPRAIRLQQLYAIRVAGSRDLKDQRERIEKIREAETTRGEAADPLLLDAIDDTLRKFDRKPTRTRTLPNLDLGKALQSAPAGTNFVFRVDNSRLPPTGFGPMGEKAGLEVTRREIVAAGGALSPAQWAGARLLASIAAVMPYEIVREAGNMRIDRSLFAVAIDPGTGAPGDILVRLDGTYSKEGLRQLLKANGCVESKEDPWSLETDESANSRFLLRDGHIEYRQAANGGREPYEAIGTGRDNWAQRTADGWRDSAPVAWRRGDAWPANGPFARIPPRLAIDVDRNNPNFSRVRVGFGNVDEADRFAKACSATRANWIEEGLRVETVRVRTDLENESVVFEGDFLTLWNDALIPIMVNLLD